MNIKNFFNFNKKENEENILFVKTSEKLQTTEELIQESKLSQSFYFMLVFSSIIVTSGILLNNIIIILAGMLISPILKPILTLALSMTVFNLKLFIRSVVVLLVSTFLIVIISFVLTTIHPSALLRYNPIFNIDFNILYFLIDIFAGMAATLAWTKKRELTELLSGTAIAVSLMPPLSWMGISIFSKSYSVFMQSLNIFYLNLISIFLGSMIIFLLSGFKLKKVADRVEEELKEENNS